MKLRFAPAKALAIGTVSFLVMFQAHAGSGEAAMEASLHTIQAVDSSAQWHNVWMPQASGNAVASAPSGDLQMGAVVAGYTRTNLDRGGWVNTLMRNSGYTAVNPLLAVGVGSGATSVAG
jgi:hypothetical protein